MKTFTVKIGKGPDEMTFDECMTHIKRVLFWDYVDGEWCDVEILSDKRWEELAGYIKGAHEREVNAIKAENEKLEKLLVQYGLFREIVGDPATEFANLRRELHALERENIKLRELVRQHVSEITDTCGDCWGGLCEDCDCWLSEHAHELRALGIEVE